MQLVRLLGTTSDGTGSYTFTLREPVTLEPGAQVALQSASLDVSSGTIEVTTANNTVNFRCQAAVNSVMTATITPGSYTPKQLATAVTNAFNTALDVDYQNAQGFEWLCTVVADKINISYDRNSTINPVVRPTFSVFGGTLTGDNFVKTDPGTGWTGYMVCKTPLIRGAGWFTVQQPDTTKYAAVSLSTTASVTDGSPVTKLMGIWRDGANYFTSDGDSGQIAAADDYFGFEVSLGTIATVLWRDNGTKIVIQAPTIFDPSVSLYPIISLYGAPPQSVKLDQTMISPFGEAQTPEVGARPTTSIVISFDTAIETADLLGFPAQQQRIDHFAASTFVATNDIDATGNDFLSLAILLESMPSIRSYDSATGGRRPIVAVANTWLKRTTGEIYYEPSNLTWLSVDNPSSMRIHSFTVRVVDINNDSPALVSGVAFVLLFR